METTKSSIEKTKFGKNPFCSLPPNYATECKKLLLLTIATHSGKYSCAALAQNWVPLFKNLN